MRLVSFAVILLVLIGGIVAIKNKATPPTPEPQPEPGAVISYTSDAAELIHITSPKPGAVISSPLKITGEAKGYWFFEASFPVSLTDWDGRIIAEGHAEAQGDWMTEQFVPFEAVLTFADPSTEADYSKRGTLILQKDNPSGLPEHDAAAEMPVRFK